jgi:hypothetical protein
MWKSMFESLDLHMFLRAAQQVPEFPILAEVGITGPQWHQLCSDKHNAAEKLLQAN